MELLQKKVHPHEPDIATDYHLGLRFEEWKQQQKELFSSPAPRWSELEEGKIQGYSSIIWNDKTYLLRQTGSLTETVLLDAQKRRKEYWQNWDTSGKSLTRWHYDYEGFITNLEEMKGSGFGHCMKINYQKTDDGRNLSLSDGRRVPEELLIQFFFGNPTASWNPRSIVRGENDGYEEHVELLDIHLPLL